MCDPWRYDKYFFAEWWSVEYYKCDGEFMAVDKDLLFPGNKEYASDKCCIILQTLKTMLSNCKKYRSIWKNARTNLSLDVRYNSKMNKIMMRLNHVGMMKLSGYLIGIRLKNHLKN